MHDPDDENVQLGTKGKGSACIMPDKVDYRALWDTINVWIEPLNTVEWPRGLWNIATGEVMLNVDVYQAMDLGKRQLEEYEAS